MSNDKEKSKYEAPILMPLGEMAKGSGACEAGSSVGNFNAGCLVYPGPYDTETCSAGTAPVDYCASGTNANQAGGSYCGPGVGAADYCSAGNCAPGPAGYCTAGDNAGADCSTGSAANL
jgi:hypothetical protein